MASMNGSAPRLAVLVPLWAACVLGLERLTFSLYTLEEPPGERVMSVLSVLQLHG